MPKNEYLNYAVENGTQAQAMLIKCLMYHKVKEDAIAVIMLMVRTDDQIAEMAEFLQKNPKATESEILEEAMRIDEM